MDYYKIDDHVEAVMLWLDDHVKTFHTPNAITLYDFHVNPSRYEGTFRLKLDDFSLDHQILDEPFSFTLGQNGKPNWYSPMFHSPLGAPASFAAVELSEITEQGIQTLLERVLPRMRPLGLDQSTGSLLTHGATIDERMLDHQNYERCFAEITGSQYTLTLMSHDHA